MITAATQPTPAPTNAAVAPGAIANSMRAGVRQGLIDLRNELTGGSLVSYLLFPAMTLFVLWLGRGEQIGDTGLTATQYMLPGLLAAAIVIGGFMGVSGQLLLEKEDGSLVRMKAIPHGLRGYVVGKTFQHLMLNVTLVVMTLLLAMIIFPEVAPHSPQAWLGLAGFAILGLVACLPAGVLMGAAIKSAMGLLIPMVLAYGLLVISGVFGPITNWHPFINTFAQIFPMYWLGLGMRSVFLPDQAFAVEIGESWRTVETFGVLGIWALVGLVLAPIVLRRMIRGVTGSNVQAARERMLSRGY